MTRTLEQVRQDRLDALREKLGVADIVRFLQQFDNGSGDYAKERHKWVDENSIDDLLKAAKARRKRARKRT